MKHSVIKFFVDFEKEEKWLNEMSLKGLHLIDYKIGRYLFEEGKPGEYIYRLELLKELPSHPESKAYLKFMEETGIEHVASHIRWVFFRKKAEDGEFDLYSDYNSKINHYKRIILLFVILGPLNVVNAVNNIVLGIGTGKGTGSYLNIIASIFCWFVAAVLLRLTFVYTKKIRKLKREKQLYE